MVDGLRPGFYFDDLIKRTAARALERLCPDHDRFTHPGSQTIWIQAERFALNQCGTCERFLDGVHVEFHL